MVQEITCLNQYRDSLGQLDRELYDGVKQGALEGYQFGVNGAFEGGRMNMQNTSDLHNPIVDIAIRDAIIEQQRLIGLEAEL